MGVQKEISIDNFPKQSTHLGELVDICYHYDPNKVERAVIVRDDVGAPGKTIFGLPDGRMALSTECHFSFVKS